MSIEEAVQEALEYVNNPPPNESNTCDWVILPLLHAAGYARRDISSRLADNNGQFPDYTVLYDDLPHTWFVEAKAWNVVLKKTYAHQALNYANQNGKRWVVLTNGREWHLYDNSIQGEVSTKQVLKVFLNNVEVITEFLEAIGKQSVCSDQLEATVYAIKRRQEVQEAQAEEQRIQSLPVQPAYLSDVRSPLAVKSHVNSDEKKRLNKFWQMLRKRLQNKGLSIDDHEIEWSNEWLVVNKRPGIDWYYYVAESRLTKVEYVLNNPKVNGNIARYLFSNKQIIEQEIGSSRKWPEKFEGQNYIIKFIVGTESFTCDEEQWPEIQEEMISKMLLLQKVLTPFIEAAEAGSSAA